MEEIKKVRLFCKGTKIVGVSLSDLFYSISRKYPMTRGAFEVSMLKLNKKPALNLKAHCLKYFQAEGEHSYEKFCREQGFVTKEFWAMVTGVKPSETVIQGQDKASAKTVARIIPCPENEQEAMREQEAMQKMLPVNWATTDFANRVDFVKRIQHNKFRDFALDLDPKLKKYFSVLKSKPPLRIKLYVTLFQFPADNYSTEAKNLLKSFVEILNTFGRANLQYVECSDPNVVEIREVR